MRFGDKDWRYHLQRWAQDNKFNKTLKPRLDKAEADWLATQPPAMPPPIIVEHPIEPGDNLDLGGAMSIHSPWKHD